MALHGQEGLGVTRALRTETSCQPRSTHARIPQVQSAVPSGRAGSGARDASAPLLYIGYIGRDRELRSHPALIPQQLAEAGIVQGQRRQPCAL